MTDVLRGDIQTPTSDDRPPCHDEAMNLPRFVGSVNKGNPIPQPPALSYGRFVVFAITHSALWRTPP